MNVLVTTDVGVSVLILGGDALTVIYKTVWDALAITYKCTNNHTFDDVCIVISTIFIMGCTTD